MDITFNPETHSYSCDGVELISVTTLLKQITPPFDRDKIAKRCAGRDGLSVEEVVKQWEEKGEASRQKGTRIHSYIEDKLTGKIDPIINELNESLPEMTAFDKAWSSLQLKLNAEVLHQEMILGSLKYGVAGRVDTIMSISVGSNRMKSIIDWKTGKFETVGRWESLLHPFNNLSNCELIRYSIQLSAYRLLYEEHHNEEMTNVFLVHLGGDGNYQVHRAIDFRSQVRKWFLSFNAVSVLNELNATR